MTEPPDPSKRDGRRGRLVASVLFGAFVVAITALLAFQVIQQAFWPDPVVTEGDCREQVHALIGHLFQARQSAAGPGTEREILHRFREAVVDYERIRPTLLEKCEGDPEAGRALHLLDQLRYAEEQALRNDSRRLSRLRGALADAAGQLSGGR